MASDNKHGDGNSNGKQLRREDLLQYSNIFASEFNNSALHDRILVLKVIQGNHGLIPPDIYQTEYSKAEDTPVKSEEEIEEVSKQK